MIGVGLPDDVLDVTGAWLDRVERSLHRIAETATGESGAASIVNAVADALTATDHFRAVLTGSRPIDKAPLVHPVPVAHVPPNIADAIAEDVAIAISIPEDMLETARAKLPSEAVGSFLLLVGHVAGSSISEIAGALWQARPDLAPAGWTSSASGAG
jgi:hypothetical protein